MELTSGRITALILGVPVGLSLIGWTGYDIVAAISPGSYPVHSSIPVSGGQLTAEINAGNITLRQAGTGSSAELTGSVQYTLFRPALTDTLTPTGPVFNFNCSAAPAGNCGFNANLAVPVRTAVTLDTGGGDLAVSGFTGNFTVTTDGGNLTTGSLSGDLNLDTGGGDLVATTLEDSNTLQIQAEGGNVTASTVTAPGADIDSGGGDVMISTALDDSKMLQIQAEGGNVAADGVAAPYTDIDSGGGDITLTFTQVPQYLQIQAEGGNITVNLPGGDARYRVSANAEGGNIGAMPQDDPAAKNVITVNSGGGDISITGGS
jgi:putative adhesin